MNEWKWEPVVEVWQKRSWLPWRHTVYPEGSGSGPFSGWCWDVRWNLNGLPDPMRRTDVPWARTKELALRSAQVRADNDHRVRPTPKQRYPLHKP